MTGETQTEYVDATSTRGYVGIGVYDSKDETAATLSRNQWDTNVPNKCRYSITPMPTT